MGMSPRNRVKITDVARSLGLSVSTVSRALNGYSDVNAETRKRIEDEVERLGYSASTIGRRLRHGRANAVGFVLPPSGYEFADPVFLPFLAGVDARLREAGRQLVVTTASSPDDDLSRTRGMVDSDQVDAMILVRVRPDDPRVAYLNERGVPFSLLGLSKVAPAAPAVEVDIAEAVRMAVERVASLGRRRIAHINVPTTFTYGRTRRAAFAAALREHGLEADPALEIEGDLSEHGGLFAAQRLLLAALRPTAMVCGNDAMAFGAMRAIVQAGLQPGRDIAVVGCDDVPMAALMNPPLTTLHIPYHDIGARVADNLIRFQAGEDPQALLFKPRPTLIVRET